jgi:hypothetical protein
MVLQGIPRFGGVSFFVGEMRYSVVADVVSSVAYADG